MLDSVFFDIFLYIFFVQEKPTPYPMGPERTFFDFFTLSHSGCRSYVFLKLVPQGRSAFAFTQIEGFLSARLALLKPLCLPRAT